MELALILSLCHAHTHVHIQTHTLKEMRCSVGRVMLELSHSCVALILLHGFDKKIERINFSLPPQTYNLEDMFRQSNIEENFDNSIK